MSKQANPYPLRIDQAVMESIKAIAEREGRSVNKQIEFVLRQFVERCSDDHGQQTKSTH